MSKTPNQPYVSKASLRRMPKYLAYLKVQEGQGLESISSTIIAEDMNLNPVQVRKDLALASDGGRPKAGYVVKALIDDIISFLGYNDTNMAILVGAGHLGKALLCYRHFDEFGLSIVAGFDIDPCIIDTEIGGKLIHSTDKMQELCEKLNVHIGVITVPDSAAQECCDLMVKSGIRGIWNFTTSHLQAPPGVIIQNENLAYSIAALSKRLETLLDDENIDKD